MFRRISALKWNLISIAITSFTPYGARARIDCATGRFSILEAGVT